MAKELNILSPGCTAISFRDVAGYGHRVSSQLIREAESFGIGKMGCELINRERQFDRTLPNGEISERFAQGLLPALQLSSP